MCHHSTARIAAELVGDEPVALLGKRRALPASHPRRRASPVASRSASRRSRSNAHDSLGEAYWHAGDRARALQRLLELNPKNDNAKMMLDALRGRAPWLARSAVSKHVADRSCGRGAWSVEAPRIATLIAIGRPRARLASFTSPRARIACMGVRVHLAVVVDRVSDAAWHGIYEKARRVARHWTPRPLSIAWRQIGAVRVAQYVLDIEAADGLHLVGDAETLTTAESFVFPARLGRGGAGWGGRWPHRMMMCSSRSLVSTLPRPQGSCAGVTCVSELRDRVRAAELACAAERGRTGPGDEG
jgi:hypothetical protein